MDEIERARLEARAEAFDDAAAIIKRSGENGIKLRTPEDFEHASLTFTNQAQWIRREMLAER